MENNTSISGTIINVQHFCVDDGPGIRTTVFLKGCPLRCAWCHNPESQSKSREYMFRQYKCTDCGICASVCKNGVHSFENGIHNVNREHCKLCGKCTLTCCVDALEISGKEITVCEIMDEVLADRVFYKRSGGVTISGGEPLFQSEFTFALLSACKDKGIHTCIETCGYGKAEDIKRIAELCDIFLFDYKLTDSALHKKYTGVNNELILENLKLICTMGANVILRCPMIPDVNMNENHYNAIAELANKYQSIREIHLEPYHPIGIGKAVSLGRTCDYDRSEFLERSELDDVCSYIADKVSVEVKVI